MADKKPNRPPLKRIYFDTNALFRWPNAANNLISPMRLANWLDTELRLPKAVEDELEGQFLRSVSRLCGDISSNINQLRKLCRYIADVPLEPPSADGKELRELFRRRSTHLKEHYKIGIVPNTKATAEFFLEMAIGRVPPFEECSIGKDRTVVAGFQDAIILHSIIEDAQTLLAGDRCAFVTNDAVFQTPKVRATLKENGINLEIFRPGDAVFKELWEYVWGAIREAWEHENQQIEQSLNRDKEELAEQIRALLPISEVGRGSWKTAKEIKGLRIRTFSFVRAELPESEHHPPDALEYARPENSQVKISTRVTVEIDATVESFNFLTVFGSQSPSPDEPEQPKLEDTTLNEMFNVSLTGTVRDGLIRDFQVVDVQRDK